MEKQFVVCVKNSDYQVSLELRKIYEAIPDDAAKQMNMIRILDESGEDYLFPAEYFIAIQLPQAVWQHFKAA